MTFFSCLMGFYIVSWQLLPFRSLIKASDENGTVSFLKPLSLIRWWLSFIYLCLVWPSEVTVLVKWKKRNYILLNMKEYLFWPWQVLISWFIFLQKKELIFLEWHLKMFNNVGFGGFHFLLCRLKIFFI